MTLVLPASCSDVAAAAAVAVADGTAHFDLESTLAFAARCVPRHLWLQLALPRNETIPKHDYGLEY